MTSTPDSYRPQAACPTRYQRTITLNGTPSIHATKYRISPLLCATAALRVSFSKKNASDRDDCGSAHMAGRAIAAENGGGLE
jgi:hypothetical protein